MSTPWQQTNSAILLMGDTGSGKTSLLATYFAWVWEKFKKISLYYAFDAGGFGDLMQALVGLGIVRIYRVRTRDVDGRKGLATGTCALVTQGQWPAEINPLTGDAPPEVSLLRPVETWHVMYCKNSHIAKKAMSTDLLTPAPCPTCKALTKKDDCLKVVTERQLSAHYADVGAVGFDGLTSMSDWCMSDMGVRHAKNELGGEKASMNPIMSSGLVFGQGNRATVGFVQNRAQDWIYNAIAIPGLVAPPVFTALVLRGSDEGGLPIYGPKIAGQAKTAEVPSWFGNVLEPATVTTEDLKSVRRLHLTRWMENNIPHLCKNRYQASGVLPDYLDDPAEAKIDSGAFTEFNLGKFMELTKEAELKVTRVYAEKFKTAPGLKKETPATPALPAAPVPRVKTPQAQAQQPQLVLTPEVTPPVIPVAPSAPSSLTPPTPAPQPAAVATGSARPTRPPVVLPRRK